MGLTYELTRQPVDRDEHVDRSSEQTTRTFDVDVGTVGIALHR
jgi:hypothetical protein